jgi:hypothetical protein
LVDGHARIFAKTIEGQFYEDKLLEFDTKAKATQKDGKRFAIRTSWAMAKSI